MASVNKVILVGNVGKDPEVRSFQTGGRVASFSLATSEAWKDKQTGERRERVEWHRISVFNEALVGLTENYIRKGSKLYVEGQMETRKWTDKDGHEKYTTEVVLRPYRGQITMLDSAKDRPEVMTPPHTEAPVVEKAPGAFDLDDHIPF